MKTEVARAVAEAVARLRSTPIGKTPLSRRAVGGKNSKDKSSFAFKSIVTDVFHIYGGWIHVNGLGAVLVPDDTTVQITGGTVDDLGWVGLRLPSNSLAWELVFSKTLPAMDGTFHFRPLHNTYLDTTTGNAVWKRNYDRRLDWALYSPIGGRG